MKIQKTLIACTSWVLLAAPLAHAADGTITFNGSVTASTCVVAGAAQTGQSHTTAATIRLPTLPASVFDSGASVAGTTNFDILLTGCLATATQQNVRTLFTTPDSVENGVIVAGANGSDTAATNIGVILQTENGTTIDVNGGANQDPGVALPSTAGDVTMKYQVSYSVVNTGAPVTAGAVYNTINYEISYF
ncbi:major type 1 subunit fimbrin (pilin) [Klebsiella oxytoca]|uniref:Major type 1 subunit fimbrin (Pilin) n=1 Tax=Klebsiella oxytoca TaxID=571 RepID=A0A318FP27_KLEOX|nr:fimbrial protein [Klebsiella oxytoca]PXW45300.1 major type 1 subunit fimbrin (pilin) [Klebsiella oxytoca]HCB1499198.1 type 1 fimbrial protein [Klebsiella michiganensis]HCB1845609.1 type 1 fimbrial protein [Klebsiella oxytoca]